jgi:hypothetical protein
VAKQSNMPAVVGDCAADLSRLLEAVQEDPIVLLGLQRFGSPESNGNTPLSSTCSG